MQLAEVLYKRAGALASLAHPEEDVKLLSALRPRDVDTIRDAALSAGTRAGVGLAGLGAYALGRGKLKERHQEAVAKEMEGKYNEMMARNPHLSKHDPAKTKEWFSILSEYAPDIARHPAVSGGWVGSQLEYGDKVPFSAVSDLINAQKAHEQTSQGRVGTSTVAAILGGSMIPGTRVGK
jgi:hypothetical protein